MVVGDGVGPPGASSNSHNLALQINRPIVNNIDKSLCIASTPCDSNSRCRAGRECGKIASGGQGDLPEE